MSQGVGKRRLPNSAMTVKGVFFDFGFVIGYPTTSIDRKYFYLDWDGIDTILTDRNLTQYLQPDVGQTELEAFFDREIYSVFVKHEQIDARANRPMLSTLKPTNSCSTGFI